MLSGGFAKEAKRSSLLQTLIAPLAAVPPRLLVLNVLQVFVAHGFVAAVRVAQAMRQPAPRREHRHGRRAAGAPSTAINV
jgi:hypothetical protein